MTETFSTLAGLLAARWEYIALYVAASAIASGVLINFTLYRARDRQISAVERQTIATATMALFFVILFLLAWFDIGHIPGSANVATVCRATGSVLVLFAATINIAGRIALGAFWSNQIEIIQGHQLVRDWPFNWSRHPLYGSLVFFGIGMGLLAVNPLVIAATLAVFVPAMRIRSDREEDFLLEQFGDEYVRYRAEVPALLPRLPEPLSKVARGALAGLQVWAAYAVLPDLMLLSALLTLALSFIMAREDFRLVYKIKPLVIVGCSAATLFHPGFAVLLWIPAAASIISLTGQCPGTWLLGRVRG